jgi:hypothetical protein
MKSEQMIACNGMDPKRFVKVEKWRVLAEQGQKRGGEGMGSEKNVNLGCKAECGKEKVHSGANGSQEDPIIIE